MKKLFYRYVMFNEVPKDHKFLFLSNVGYMPNQYQLWNEAKIKINNILMKIGRNDC